MDAVLIATTSRAHYPDLAIETDGAAQALDGAGLPAVPAAWHDEGIDWSTASAVLVRTTWDYPDHVDEFCQWLDRLDACGAIVFNSTRIIRWNLRKTYLFELGQRGVDIVPVEFVSAGTEVRSRGTKLVTKPVVGVGSSGAWLLGADETHRVGQDSLVSPFQERIMDGELSVFIVDGKPVYTIRKTPASSDWRVQPQWGGSYAIEMDPPGEAVARALDAFEAVDATFQDGSDLTFLRADLVQSKVGTWRILEVEAIEPSFYTAQTPAIADAVAQSVRNRLQPLDQRPSP